MQRRKEGIEGYTSGHVSDRVQNRKRRGGDIGGAGGAWAPPLSKAGG